MAVQEGANIQNAGWGCISFAIDAEQCYNKEATNTEVKGTESIGHYYDGAGKISKHAFE